MFSAIEDKMVQNDGISLRYVAIVWLIYWSVCAVVVLMLFGVLDTPGYARTSAEYIIPRVLITIAGASLATLGRLIRAVNRS